MKNLDTIDVTYNREQIQDIHFDVMTLILNGTPIKGTFDAIGFVCSGEFKRIETELMTCSCGCAGCAGIFYGTDIKRRKHTVEWRDIDCGFPKKFYSFDKKEYDATIEKTYNYLLDIVKRREIEAEELGDGEWFRYTSVSDFEDGIGYAKEYYREYKTK